MRWSIFAVAAFAFLVLEMSLGNVLAVRSLGNISPSFVAVLAVFITLFAPRSTALWACWVLGLLVDLSIYIPHGKDLPGPLIGPHALGYSGAGMLLLHIRSMLFRGRALTVALTTVIFVAAASAVVMLIYAIQNSYPGGHLDWVDRRSGGEIMRRLGVALYSGALAFLLARPMIWTMQLWSFRSTIQRSAGWR